MKVLSDKKVLLVLLILLLSIPIFQSSVYRFLVYKIGIGFAYSIDQFLPLVVTCLVAFIAIRKQTSIRIVKRYVSSNAMPLLVIILTALIVHGWVLGNYFFGEEPNAVLRPVNIGEVENPLDLRGYHLGMYILSYELFYTHVIFYNIVALLFYILTTIILYIFLNYLFNQKISPALVGTLFFVITPAYMDIFSWHLHFLGMPIALSVGLLCLISLLAYQKNSKPYFYLLSLMFYLSMLKISFARLHGFIALPLFMCLFPLLSSTHFYKSDIKRFALLVLPYVCILSIYLLIVFLLPDHIFLKLFPSLFPGSEYAGADITLTRKVVSFDGYWVILSLLIAYLFIPSRVAEVYYPKLKEFLQEFPFIPTDISLTFFFGTLIIIILSIAGFVALKNIKKTWGRLTAFSLIVLFANLVFIPLLIQGYSDITQLDQRIASTSPGNGPGIRYVFVSSMGLAMFIAAVTFLVSKHRKSTLIFLVPIFALITYYSYLNISSHLDGLKGIHPAQSAVPNSVFSMVPRDGYKKILYSANPAENAIDKKIGGWLYAFYKPDELLYTKSLEEVKKLISSGKHEKSNFYAFYNNTQTQTFKDVSQLAKNEFFDNKVSQETTKLIQGTNLNTSFIETKNPFLPFVLKRGVYISESFNQQLLSPRQLSISVEKSMLPIKFPYVDGNILGKDYQDLFPRSVWDSLNSRPLDFSVKQINLAFTVKSLNNYLITELSSESRIKVAKEFVNREVTNKEEIIMSDLEKVNKHYIDSQEILNVFLDSPSFNSLALLYVCAEDVDFEKQKMSSQMIGGIWYSREFPLKNDLQNEELFTPITCYGSKLRQIILIGPPIPSEIMIDVYLSKENSELQ